MRSLLLIVGIIVLVSCGKQAETKFASLDEFEAYVNDVENGYIVSSESANLLFEAKLVPAVDGDGDPMSTVHIRISQKDGGSVLDYGGIGQDEVMFREGYLSFEILKDVFLESENGLTPPTFHHYERNYGLKPSIDMFFQFPEFTPSGDVSLNYRDELFGQGLVKLKFNKERFTKCYVEKA